MAELYFDVKANYEEVIRLREELNRLELQITATAKATGSLDATAELQQELKETSDKLNELVDGAAKAGAELDNNINLGLKNASGSAEQFASVIGGVKEGLSSYIDEQTRSGKMDEETAEKAKKLVLTLESLQGVLNVVKMAQAANATQTAVGSAATTGFAAAQTGAAVATTGLTAAVNALNVAMKANPIGLALSIIPLAITAVSSLTASTEGASSEVKEFNKAVESEIGNLDDLYEILGSTNSSTKTHREALDEVNEMCKKYNTTLLSENDTLEQQKKKYDELTLAIRAANAEKVGGKYIDKAQEKADKRDAKALKGLRNQFSMSDIPALGGIREDVWAQLALQTQTSASGLAELSGAAYDSRLRSIVNEFKSSLVKNSDATSKEVESVDVFITRYVNSLAKNAQELNKTTNNIKSTISSFTPERRFSIENMDEATFEQLEAEWGRLSDAIEDEEDSFEKIGHEANKRSVESRMLEKAVSGTLGELKDRKRRLEKEIDDLPETSEQISRYQEIVKAIDTEIKKRNGRDESTKKTKPTVDREEEKALQAREKAYERYGAQMAKQITNIEDKIANAQISAMEDSSGKVNAKLAQEKAVMLRQAEEIGAAMTALFSGNVDLLHRNTIDASRLSDKGWSGAGDGIATVFSSSYGLEDNKGVVHELLVTPILPNGEVLSEQELQDYLYNRIEGATDMLAADSVENGGLGLVIAVDVPEDGGEKLHEMQELYYELIQLIEEYNKMQGQQANADSLKEIMDKYKDLDAQRDEIASGYDKDIASLKTAESAAKTVEEREKINKAIIQAEKEKNKELENFDLKHNEKVRKAFGDVAKMTTAEVAQSIKTLEALLNDGTDRSEENIEAIQNALKNLRAVNEDFSFDGLMKRFSKAIGENGKKGLTQQFKNIKDAWNNMSQEQKWSAVGGWVNGIAGGLGQAAEYMSQIAEATGNDGLKESADQMSAIAQNFSAAAQGAASGGWIGAIVGGVTDIIGQTINAFSESAVQTAIMKKNAEDFANALQLAALTVDKTKFESIFGTDKMSLAQEYATKMAESLGAYGDELDELNKKTNKDTLLLFGLGSETHGLKVLQRLKKELQGIQDMRIKTKDRSGWANFWGASDEFTRLADLAPQIFDGENINLEALEAFLDTNTQISEEQRSQLENLLEMHKAYEENKKALEDYLSGLFGNMSADLAQATIDGMRSGSEIGAQYMRDNMLNSITSLEQQLVQGVYNSYLSKYQQRFMDTLEGGGDEEDLLALYAEMFTGMDDTIQKATLAAEQFELQAEKYGFDMDKLRSDYEEQASKGSFQGMTQQMGAALEGRFTAVQISNEAIREQASIANAKLDAMMANAISSVRIAEEIQNTQAAALIELQAINRNTRPLANMAEEISTIRSKVERL